MSGTRLQLGNCDDKKRVVLYFEGDAVTYISAIHQDCTYAAFLELVNKAIIKYGEPQGTYFDEDEKEYNVYWWATDPVCDVRISISLDKPFTVMDYVFYGK